MGLFGADIGVKLAPEDADAAPHASPAPARSALRSARWAAT